MTEFITRSCKAESRYEVIIKTDSEEHYKATEDFARRLIDHAKPKTKADCIRSMDDETLAMQFAQHEYAVAKEVLALCGIDITKTEHNIEASAADMLEQLQQPCEED